MKNIIKTILFFSLSTILFSCGEDGVDNSSKTAFVQSVAKTWTVNESTYVLLDNQDITSALMGFEISIDADLNYTTNSKTLVVDALPWPSEGSFTVNDELTQFTRNDGLVITVSVDENNIMTFDFQFDEGYDDSTSGRSQAIQGQWNMQFN